MAILAGIVAQVLEDYLGHIGPFQGAIALTVLALVLVLQWNENYGEEKEGRTLQVLSLSPVCGGMEDDGIRIQCVEDWNDTGA